MKVFAETERLILREILPTDIEGMFELDSNPIVHKHLGKKPVKSREASKKIIESIREQYEVRGIGRWAAIEKSSGDFMGWSGLKFNTDKKDELNGKRNFYDIGYRFIPRFWGKGYATESSLITLDFGFKELNLELIVGAAEIENIASNKVLQKIGLNYIEDFDFEGTRASWYELQKEEYKAIQNKLTRQKYYLKNKERLKKLYRERYQKDPDYNKKTLERAKNRYHNDPEYREKTIERAKARYKRKKFGL